MQKAALCRRRNGAERKQLSAVWTEAPPAPPIPLHHESGVCSPAEYIVSWWWLCTVKKCTSHLLGARVETSERRWSEMSPLSQQVFIFPESSGWGGGGVEPPSLHPFCASHHFYYFCNAQAAPAAGPTMETTWWEAEKEKHSVPDASRCVSSRLATRLSCCGRGVKSVSSRTNREKSDGTWGSKGFAPVLWSVRAPGRTRGEAKKTRGSRSILIAQKQRVLSKSWIINLSESLVREKKIPVTKFAATSVMILFGSGGWRGVPSWRESA